MRRLATAILIFSIASCAWTNNNPAPTPGPQIDPADIIAGTIVVDFVDGTTKSDYDAYEQNWGPIRTPPPPESEFGKVQ